MFKCDKCQKMTKPNESCGKIVVEKRAKNYVNKIKPKERHQKERIVESKGWEIAREIQLCPKCYGEETSKYE